MAEQTAVNRLVVGSNPTLGAKFNIMKREFIRRRPTEPSIKCYLITYLVGWANLLDGIVEILSFGMLNGSFGFECVKWVARERYKVGGLTQSGKSATLSR